MTAALLWKEYRQQRAFWLVIAGIALFCAVCIPATLGRGSGWATVHDASTQSALVAVVIVLVLVHGVGTGAMLLAEDKEVGAMPFLDGLTGWRSPVFAAKACAGLILTLSLSLGLVALSFSFGFGSWGLAWYLPLSALQALAWGLLGGALCGTTLTAWLSGFGLMAVVQFLLLLAAAATISLLDLTKGLALPLIITSAAAGCIAAGYGSWRVYCRDDLARRPDRTWPRFNFLPSWLSDCQALLWLTLRQGRWMLLGCGIAAVVVGFAAHFSPLGAWPLGMLIVGLCCGLAAFTSDQEAGNRFFGAQRFPSGKLWTIKVLIWGTCLVGLTALAWGTAALTFGAWDTNIWIGRWLLYLRLDNRGSIIGWRYRFPIGSPVLFFAMWPLYGFSFGQFFGQLARRPIVAAILAGIGAFLFAALWATSLRVGGVPFWQVLIVPCLLILTTRVFQWPWMCGRLASARTALGVAGVLTLTATSLAACLWYRAVEVPDVGEPFDMKSFLASLPSPQLNQAGRLLHSAIEEMDQREKQVERELSSGAPRDTMMKLGNRLAPTDRDWLVERIADVGWTKDDEQQMGPWLDLVFKGDWAKKATAAAQLPLGMVRDPRLANLTSVLGENDRPYAKLAYLFVARALQLQARGDSGAALNHLETVLALSNQVKNYASGELLGYSYFMEEGALSGMQFWMQGVAPNKDLLLSAQAILKRHRKDCPDPANGVKADYLIYRNSDPPAVAGSMLSGKAVDLAYGVPWEKQRQDRIASALFQGKLWAVPDFIQNSQKPRWESGRLPSGDPNRLTQIATKNGLPPKDGPGSDIGARRWGEYISEAWVSKTPLVFYRKGIQAALPASELVVALALYQTDRGRLPAKLDELVPAYLPELPTDPSGDKPFRYGISDGEEFDRNIGQITLPRGQAYLMSADGWVYPVPFWPKQKEDQP